MPFFDRTGPMGRGARTGWGWGWCSGVGDFETEVNAVYRPRFEAATTQAELLAVAQAWLDAGAAYGYAHDWPQRDIDNLMASIQKQVQSALPLLRAGLSPTLANRWNAFVTSMTGSPNPMRTTGNVLMGLGISTFILGTFMLAANLVAPDRRYGVGGIRYPVLPE